MPTLSLKYHERADLLVPEWSEADKPRSHLRKVVEALKVADRREKVKGLPLNLVLALRHLGVSVDADPGAAAAIRRYLSWRSGILASKGVPWGSPPRWLHRDPKVYQSQATNFFMKVGSGLLGDDVGLGKTFAALILHRVLLERGDGPAIVVCQSTQKYGWREEYLESFGAGEAGKVVVIDGSREERAHQWGIAIRRKAPLVVTNPESLRPVVRKRSGKQPAMVSDGDLPIARKWVEEVKPAVAFFDEASAYLRNSTSGQYQACTQLVAGIPRRIPITATPIESKVENLYNVMRFAGARNLFGSAAGFRELFVDEFIVRPKRGRPFPKLNGYKNLDLLATMIAPAMIRRTPSEVGVEVPRVMPIVRRVQLGQAHLTAYRNVAAEVKEEPPLRRMARVLEAADDPRVLGIPVQGAKAEHLGQLLRGELAHKQVIVFSKWERVVDLLMGDLADLSPVKIAGSTEPVDRDRIKRAFNAGGVRVIVATEAASRGLDLHALEWVVNFDLPWNPSDVYQRAGRGRRITSEQEFLFLLNLVSLGTEEEDVLEQLGGKDGLARAAVGASDVSILPEGEVASWK